MTYLTLNAIFYNLLRPQQAEGQCVFMFWSDDTNAILALIDFTHKSTLAPFFPRGNNLATGDGQKRKRLDFFETIYLNSSYRLG